MSTPAASPTKQPSLPPYDNQRRVPRHIWQVWLQGGWQQPDDATRSRLHAPHQLQISTDDAAAAAAANKKSPPPMVEDLTCTWTEWNCMQPATAANQNTAAAAAAAATSDEIQLQPRERNRWTHFKLNERDVERMALQSEQSGASHYCPGVINSGDQAATYLLYLLMSSWNEGIDQPPTAEEQQQQQQQKTIPKTHGMLAPSRSDLCRLLLLWHYGGVWADSTMLCQRPLDDWVDDYVVRQSNASGMWMYRGYQNGEGGAVWFIVAMRHSELLRRWIITVAEFWQHIRQTGNNYPYDWIDHTFMATLTAHPAANLLWNRYTQPQPLCSRDGSSHCLYGMLDKRVDQDNRAQHLLRCMRDAGDGPLPSRRTMAAKFWWRDWRTNVPTDVAHPESLGRRLIEASMREAVAVAAAPAPVAVAAPVAAAPAPVAAAPAPVAAAPAPVAVAAPVAAAPAPVAAAPAPVVAAPAPVVAAPAPVVAAAPAPVVAAAPVAAATPAPVAAPAPVAVAAPVAAADSRQIGTDTTSSSDDDKENDDDDDDDDTTGQIRLHVVVARYREDLAPLLRVIDESCDAETTRVHVFEKCSAAERCCPDSQLLRNVGREAHTFLTYIVQNYWRWQQRPRLVDYHAFTQARYDDTMSRQDVVDLLIGRRQARGLWQMTAGGWQFRLRDWRGEPQHDAGCTFGEFWQQVLGDYMLPVQAKATEQDNAKYRKEAERAMQYATSRQPDEGHVWWNGTFRVSRQQLLSRPLRFYQRLLDRMAGNGVHPEIGHYLERMWWYIFNRKSFQ